MLQLILSTFYVDLMLPKEFNNEDNASLMLGTWWQMESQQISHQKWKILTLSCQKNRALRVK